MNYFSGTFSFDSLANHSKLEVLDLLSYNAQLKVDTECKPFVPQFQLSVLRLSNCSLNGASKVIPSFLFHQHELQVLDLSHNGIIGRFPDWLLTNNTRLQLFNLANNLLTGPLHLNCTSKYKDVNFLDLSYNPIRDEIPSCLGSVFPSLKFLNMTTNALQGSIPTSLADLKLLVYVDLSNNNISGYMPEGLVLGSSRLEFMKFSNNKLHGPLLSRGANLSALRVLRLDNNNFTGEISSGLMNSSQLRVLDLSNNHFSGRVPSWIGNFSQMRSLVLSRNSFEGSLPTGLCKLRAVTYLNVSWNQFSGSLPSCLNMPILRYLHMQKNNFQEELIPSVIAQSPLLLTLDLMDNRFSGVIPAWIFHTFSDLQVLLLKGNMLQGSIPADICQLLNIRILDLSHNNLSGLIPSCLNDMSFGKLDASSGTVIGEYYLPVSTGFKKYLHSSYVFVTDDVDIRYLGSDEEREVEFMTKSMSESYKGNILYFMSGLDLSCNKLTGPIPQEIGHLIGIHTLNLSNNQLTGPIPETFSCLEQIESLDLSNNELSGPIPPDLVDLFRLSVFVVAYNNLSGKTPDRKNQFATFERSSYEGNPFLCGLPLQQSCKHEEKPLTARISSDSRENDFKHTFIPSFIGSFLVAFVGVIAWLYLNSYFR